MWRRWPLWLLAVVLSFVALVSVVQAVPRSRSDFVEQYVANYRPGTRAQGLNDTQCAQVLMAARALTTQAVRYDPAYVGLTYPNGDVPALTGVCADLVVRSFRAVGHDLQQLVHEDMRSGFANYPRLWGLVRPDANIDHRRVPNLMTYLTRHHRVLPLSPRQEDYQACDIVAWDLGGGVTHIGLVSDRRESSASRPLILHHIGGTPNEVDVLFAWRVIGHYAW